MAETSIRRRMVFVVMATTLLALLLSSAALLFQELRTYRAAWLEDLEAQANLVARSSVPALTFDDARVARENLALLRQQPQIEAAAIYGVGNRLFASFTATGQEEPPPQLVGRQEGAVFTGDKMELRRPIEQGGERLGTMYLRARYDVAPRLHAYLAILVAVSVASLALASLITWRLQRTITDPIVSVADVARSVMQQRNYGLRAPKKTSDEVGALVDAFNDMLRELGAQDAALQAADRRKDEFLAMLAHELRNPLAPLATALAILERDDAGPATQRRMREIMQRQLRQLVRLIDDLLDVARISTGRLELRMGRLDLVEVAQSAVESVASDLEARRHAMVVDWPPCIWLIGDRARLAQVFVNLLSNAAKYTDPGGRIELAFETGASHVEVRVVDNGMGIAPSMQRDVFEMFVQVDKSLDRGRSGLGVGLALARQLVDLHGGTLELRSAGLGHGSTFSVRLPLVPATSLPHSSEKALVVSPAAGKLRILLADDNRDFADTLASVLEAAGHRVTVVYDGKAALEAASIGVPDVGLFDIGMPGLNGYELAATLRQRHRDSNLLLVAITGWGQDRDQRRASESGFDEHIVKPVDAADLLGLLARRSGRGDANRSAQSELGGS